MITSPIPSNEKERLADLYDYQLLDTDPEKEFDDLVMLASNICNTPISYISLLDSQRQWLKASVGMNIKESPRKSSICGHTICEELMLEIPDIRSDQRFIDNSFVHETLGIRFYAGVNLISEKGYKLGTLCVTDNVPKKLTEDQRQALIVLGKQVMKQLELRLRNLQLEGLMEKEVRQRRELEAMYRAQQQISSIIAHDVRNPLGAVSSTLAMYKRNIIAGKDVSTLLDLANTQIDSTLGTLNNLVEWGKILAEGRKTSSFNIAEITKTVFDELQVQATLKGNELINTVDSDLTVFFDANILTFVLRNLAGNSLKFTEAGTITVTAGLSNRQLEISIADTGIGMPLSVAENLFTNKQKSWRRGTRNEPGSGLGLLLVKEFIVTAGGSISVESEEGKGTRFRIFLPEASKN